MTSWKNKLVGGYPALFNVEVRGVVRRPGWPTCSDGWADLLDRMMRRISTAIADEPRATLRIWRIAEEFGRLRVQYECSGLSGTARGAVDEAVALGEARSACTCELCGAEGRLHMYGPWLLTLCGAHADGEAFPVDPDPVATEIKRAGKTVTRRYDRDGDCFIDVGPTPLGGRK